MRIAKDGKKFDEDILDELAEDEVEIIQFLRPNGRRRRMSTRLDKEFANKAKDIILSAEELPTGQVALYGRKIGTATESEYMLIADNGLGNNSPNEVLKIIINHVFGDSQ